MRKFFRRWGWGCSSLGLAAAIWLPSVHFFFARNPADLSRDPQVTEHARQLAAKQLAVWNDSKLRESEVVRMRASNAEWDFMGRCFLTWSMGEMALRAPARRAEYLTVMDRIIDETLQAERREGLYFFLMPYARAGAFLQQPERSQFLDSEIALMLAVRRLVEEKADYKALLQVRIATMSDRMQCSPVLSCESYPDECWTFCNTIALTAIKLGDHLDGTDHSELLRDWVKVAKEKLVDPKTGLLVSSYAWNGRHKDGPEGSSIWMSAHCLRLVDAEFAEDQYRRARNELGKSVLGFGYALEWPASLAGPADVDSGPVIPVLGASAGSSGLALVAASSFNDSEYLKRLRTTLEFAAFPVRRSGGLRYSASNQVGDAVMLYAAVLGPAWEAVKKGKH